MTPRGTLTALGLIACACLGESGLAASFQDDMAQRTLACTACHGNQGRAGPDGYYPRLAGKPAGYLYNQLRNFQEGRRHYGLMTRMVGSLSDAYLHDIARHFGSLELPYPPPASSTDVPPEKLASGRRLVQEGDPSRGVPACIQCHGHTLTGVTPNIPGLVGLPRDYLNAQLGGWRVGDRRARAPDCMATIVQRMNADDISSVSAWLASQTVPTPAHPSSALPVPTAVANRPHIDLPCGSAPELASGGRP